MRPYAIDVRIESVVVHGLGRIDRNALAGALERHLTMLLYGTARGRFDWHDTDVGASRAAPVTRAAPGADNLGRELAASLHEVIVHAETGERGGRT